MVHDTSLRMILAFSFILVNIGLLFKIYASPFHFWVADIYQGSPTSTTMSPSTIPVVVYAYIYILFYTRIFYHFLHIYCYIFLFFPLHPYYSVYAVPQYSVN
jgi:NADH-quinone oxidoreductase subunit N